MMTSVGKRGRFERDRQALDDIGAVAGDRSLRDRLHRAEIRAGVVFGDPDDQPGHHQSNDAAKEQRGAGIVLPRHGAEADQEMDHQRHPGERKHAGDDEAA